MSEEMTLVDLTDDIAQEAITAIDAEPVPTSWQLLRLGDVVMVKGGKRLPKGADFAAEPTPYPYIRIMDFANGSVDTRELKYLTPDIQREISRYIIGKEDVYISIAGTTGIVGIIPPQLDGANLTENAAKLVIKDQNHLNKDFLALFLSSKAGQTQIRYLTTKTSQPKLALVRIEQIRISLPPFPEQRAIAHALRRAQAAREVRRREAALERERKAALMQRLFTQGTRGEPTKTTEIGEVPASWHFAPFSELVHIVQGQVDPRAEPYSDMAHVGPENIGQGTGQLSGIRTNRELKIISGNYYFTTEHVLYSKIRPYLNKVALPNFEGTCSADMYPLQPRQKRLTREFLFYWLLSEQFKTQATAFQNRTGIPKINRDELNSIPLPEPPLEEQCTIAAILRASDDKIAALEREAAAHDELFKALLEELMTGRLRATALIEG